MKKTLFFLSLLLGLVVSGMTLVSCSDDEELSPLKTIPNGVKAVDLGLPSGTLWANMNVGALKEEGTGYYFAWGETEPNSEYNWSTYKWCNGDVRSMTKYCSKSYYGYNGFTDNKTELDPMDDAAYMNWGSEWRMPSYAQCEELVNSSYTTTVWTTQNGVNGRKITSKVNGNSIFLPAVGERSFRENGWAGKGGFYWSRTLNTDATTNALNLNFDSKSVGGERTRNVRSRMQGQSVRPVRNQ